MKTKIVGIALALFLGSSSIASANTYSVTFENTLIDNNPNYPITGSFLFDAAQSQNPVALYGLSNLHVLAVTPFGSFEMNTVWTVDSTFTYLGLETGPCCSSTVPALIFVFPNQPDGNADNLQIAAASGAPLLMVPLGSGSNLIPGGSALTPSVMVLYDGPSSDLLSVSGSLVPSPTPLPAALPLFATGLGVVGLFCWRGKRKIGMPEKHGSHI